MMEPDLKSEISLEGDTILSKIGKLTTAHSPRVISCDIMHGIWTLRLHLQLFDICTEKIMHILTPLALWFLFLNLVAID